MQWFRLYNEFAFDPKIQSMDETSQRRFIIVLCLQCDGSLKKLSDDEIAVAMRITSEQLKESKELFIQKGFIDESWNVINWDKRQYNSDTSTQRTRAWRERQKQNVTETSPKRHKNASVTPPDTDTDTDNKPPKSPRGEYTEGFEKFWKQYPKKIGKDAAFKKWKQVGKDGKATAGELIQAIITQVQANHFRGANGDGEFIPNPATWLHQGRWKDEIKTKQISNNCPPADNNPETRYQD